MIDKLKRWLSGDADWKAEQKLDQLGKNDPFLADAMEGYRSMPESDHASVVKDLKAKLPVKMQSTATKGASISWKAIAAAASLIGVIGLFIWTQNSFDSSGSIAQTRQQQKSETPAPGAPIEELKKINESDEIIAFEEESAQEAESEVLEEVPFNDENNAAGTIIGNTVNPNAGSPRVDPSNIEAGITEEDDLYVFDGIPVTEEEPPTFEDDNVKDRIATSEDDVIVVTAPPSYAPPPAAADAAPPPVIAEAKNEAVAKDKAKESAEARRFEDSDVSANYSAELFSLSGTVIDLSNEDALIGANVYVKGTGEGTVTDVDGRFTLQSSQPLPWTVGVSYIGYNDTEIEVSDVNKPIRITLDGSNVALESVEIQGYRADKKKRSKSAVEEPKPVKGFKKYERYIRKNLKYPTLAKQNKIQGGVTVRFFINEEGKPEDAKIITSIGSGCDAEAIRLIEEGPEWKPRNVWAIYTVVFKL